MTRVPFIVPLCLFPLLLAGCTPCDPLNATTCPVGQICTLGLQCVPPQYAVNADAGTVADEVTGLVWQQVAPGNACAMDGGIAGTCPEAGAAGYCNGLMLDGHAGWTVPTLVQLFSIVMETDAGPGAPEIDSAVFQSDSSDFWFWTSSDYPLDTTGADNWAVNFGGSSDVGEGPGSYIPDGGVDPMSDGPVFSVRCVYGSH